jgi:hypothetical protein
MHGRPEVVNGMIAVIPAGPVINGIDAIDRASEIILGVILVYE